MFYNLVEIQFSANIEKLKTDNRGEYVNKEITATLELQGISHDSSQLYAYKNNGWSVRMNRTIVTIVWSMTLDYADMIPQLI
jgi:hypothetical protein